MPTQKIIFFRTPWMNHYKGITKDDIPQNGGSWVKENNDAHEAYNFTNCGRYYYGFAQPNRLDLSRIENTKEEFIDNTLVIFFSTKPGEGGQYIIGWYKNATVYKFHQEIFHKNRKPKYKWYHAKAKTGNGYLVPSTDRLFELPVRPGENNVWYGKEYLSKTQLEKILKYIQDPVGYFKKSVKTLKKPRQYDIEKRLKVEHAAMDAVWEHYSYLEYTLTDVSGKKIGWDLEAQKGNKKLIIEVKGLSENYLCVELTPNEFKHFKEAKSNYCLAVLLNALKPNKKLYLFKYAKNINAWRDIEGNGLKIKKIDFAQVTLA